ncbi:MAG: thiamine pyrophosphate-binding protein [Alphaproteobacteria bacterium]|nr:thiamine pyrophosphate-binding protein [Alphaproteobacteria bacterium]
MHLDRPEGEADKTVGWGSDIAAQMLRRFNIRYVSLNPGASYRGLHDSLVNHLGNERPGILLCLHEDHSVSIAHGYARATGEPMACVLHANVGLFHGMMGLFNAWCDRAPMLVLGATGPLATEKRRPWIDWIHTMRDQGALVRDFVKWDDQPTSPEGLVESMVRANLITRTAPTAPVYVCLDAGLQEQKLDKEPEWPDLARFLPPPPSRPAKAAIDAAVAILDTSTRVVILAGRGLRTDAAWDARIALAERLGAVVMSDLKTGAKFPTDHPAHVVPPFNQVSKPAREILTEADCILSLDWADVGGALKQAASVGKVTAKIIGASLDQMLHSGAGMEYQALPPMDVFMPTTSDALVEDLVAALGPGKKAPWRERAARKVKQHAGDGVTLDLIASSLRGQFNDPQNVTFACLNRGWPADIWPLTSALSYLGKDGGGGLGSGPGLSVGAALALHEMGRYAVSVLGDGDFCMGATAIWTAVRHRIPLLILIDNNRSYFNDELHQENVAKARGREVRNRWIGLRMEDPLPDIVMLARAQGATAIGPVTKASDVNAALEQGVAVLKQGGVAVIDFHVDPSEDRISSASAGGRKTS